MTAYVFLGASLPRAEAERLVDARFLPPIAGGDLRALLDKRPSAIAILDGELPAPAAVWHKEILLALSCGVRVFGAAGVGALRAAELCSFGMEGVGRIFELYRDGTVEDDDEIVTVPGAVAMVDLRHGLEHVERAGGIRRETRELLVAAAKARFFPQRSWRAVIDDAERLAIGAGERAALESVVVAGPPSLVRADAAACLQHLAAELARGLAPHQPRFEFHATRYWRAFDARVTRRIE